MAFPFEVDEEIIDETIMIPKEYEIDYDTGQLTGKIVEGTEAIKVWIWNALHTSRYRHVIYSWDYGNELDEMVGQSFTQEYIEVEAKRMVEDCLLVNENISSIEDFKIEQDEDTLSIALTAITLFGEVVINV